MDQFNDTYINIDSSHNNRNNNNNHNHNHYVTDRYYCYFIIEIEKRNSHSRSSSSIRKEILRTSHSQCLNGLVYRVKEAKHAAT